jgi:hypothetical protein
MSGQLSGLAFIRYGESETDIAAIKFLPYID